MRVIVACIWFVALMAAGAIWTAMHEPHARLPEQGAIVPAPFVIDFDALERDAAPRVDLYGNEIEDAIGDYRIDRRGDVYERRSPDTAVTRLPAPVL